MVAEQNDNDSRARSIFDQLRATTAFPPGKDGPGPSATGSKTRTTRRRTKAEPDTGSPAVAVGDDASGPAPDLAPVDDIHPDPPPEPVTWTSTEGDTRDEGDRTDNGETDAPEERLVVTAPESAATSTPAAPLVPRILVPPDLDAALLKASAPVEGALPLDDRGRPKHPAAVKHPLPRCIAIANQKGGVGKTTTTVNLGAGLAELGYRVLVVDLDPQGNATTGLGVNGRNLDSSVYDVILHEVPIEDVIEPSSLRNLFVVPATIDLAGAEIELVPVFSRELRLRRALETVHEDFDFVLLDCPPSLGLLTVNALAAAGEVLVPIQCEYYALEGLSQLLRNVNLVKSNLNSALELSTIVLTMYDARTKLAEHVAEEVRGHFGNRVCRNVVPRTVRLSEAPSFGQPITTFDPSSRGAIAYRELAREVSGGTPQRVG
jgi:chromosome partitioning protein